MAAMTTPSQIHYDLMTVCAFCNEEVPSLCDSHLIPRFVQDRFRNDGGVQTFLRESNVINKPQQQLFHRPWLCTDCEQVLSRDEAYFAATVDQPFGQETLHSVTISEQHMRFCAGLAWRVISWGPFRPSEGMARSEAFHGRWAAHAIRQYLLGNARHPGNIEHHLYFPPMYRGPRRGVNTFFGAMVSPSVITSGGYVYTMAILGGYAAITLLNPEHWNPGDWDGGTRLSLGGKISISSQRIPNERFHEVIDEMTALERRVNAEMSGRQRQRIRDRFAALPANFKSKSRAWRCIEADLENRREFGPNDGDI
jgi:hypothetical protein